MIKKSLALLAVAVVGFPTGVILTQAVFQARFIKIPCPRALVWNFCPRYFARPECLFPGELTRCERLSKEGYDARFE